MQTADPVGNMQGYDVDGGLIFFVFMDLNSKQTYFQAGQPKSQIHMGCRLQIQWGTCNDTTRMDG